MGQKSWSGDPPLDRPARRRGLHDAIAAPTGQLYTNMPDHLESETGCARAPPIHLLPTCVAVHRSPGSRLLRQVGSYLPGRCAGSGRRTDRATASTLAIAFPASPQRSLRRLTCSASSCSSSCSICRSSFSDERPNCMRRSLAINSFNCSILTIARYSPAKRLFLDQFMLRDDQGFQFGGIQLFEIGKNTSRVIHCRKIYRSCFTVGLKSHRKDKIFCTHTAICGS